MNRRLIVVALVGLGAISFAVALGVGWVIAPGATPVAESGTPGSVEDPGWYSRGVNDAPPPGVAAPADPDELARLEAAGGISLPDNLPVYPGSTPVLVYFTAEGINTGQDRRIADDVDVPTVYQTYQAPVGTTPDELAAFYRDELTAAGFTGVTSTGDGSGPSLYVFRGSGPGVDPVTIAIYTPPTRFDPPNFSISIPSPGAPDALQ